MSGLKSLRANEVGHVSGAGGPIVQSVTFQSNSAGTLFTTFVYCADPNFSVHYNGETTYGDGGLANPGNYSCVPVGSEGSHTYYRVNGTNTSPTPAGAFAIDDPTHHGLDEAIAAMPLLGTLAAPPEAIPITVATGSLTIFDGDLLYPPGQVQMMHTGDGGWVITAGPGYGVALKPGATDVLDRNSYTISGSGSTDNLSPPNNCVLYDPGANTTMTGTCHFQDSAVDPAIHSAELKGNRDAEATYREFNTPPPAPTYDIDLSDGSTSRMSNDFLAAMYVHGNDPMHSVGIQERGYYGAVFNIPDNWGEGGSDCMDIAPPIINVNISPEMIQLLTFQALLANELYGQSTISDPTLSPAYYDPSVPYYDPGTYLGPSGGGCP